MEHLLHAQAAGSTAMLGVPNACHRMLTQACSTRLTVSVSSCTVLMRLSQDTEEMQCSADQQRGDGLDAVTVLPASAPESFCKPNEGQVQKWTDI